VRVREWSVSGAWAEGGGVVSDYGLVGDLAAMRQLNADLAAMTPEERAAYARWCLETYIADDIEDEDRP
jgi:hypothetical protein